MVKSHRIFKACALYFGEVVVVRGNHAAPVFTKPHLWSSRIAFSRHAHSILGRWWWCAATTPPLCSPSRIYGQVASHFQGMRTLFWGGGGGARQPRRPCVHQAASMVKSHRIFKACALYFGEVVVVRGNHA